jgi:Protein of unknown function (DUF3455)
VRWIEELILSGHLEIEGITMTQHFFSASLVIALINLGSLQHALGATPLKIAQVNSSALPQAPESLKVPSNQSLLMKTAAKGLQIYTCKAKTEPNTAYEKPAYEWTLKAPSAELFDDQGQLVGKHYAGPTWEMQKDHSLVVGAVSAKANAPQADAIPWLLLKAKSHQGKGILSSVSWVQRLDTVGGKAPTTGCDQSHQDAEVQIPYTANYYFYRSDYRSDYHSDNSDSYYK